MITHSVRLWAQLMAVVIAASMLSACGILNEDRLAGSCGIAVDGSGSAATKTGFDAASQIEHDVNGFLFQAKCRQVVFAAISGESRNDYCNQAATRIDLDPDDIGNARRVTVRAANRLAAKKEVQTLLTCIKSDPRSVDGSDILGGLAALADRRPDTTGTYQLLVISDFVIYVAGRSVGSDLATPEARQRAVNRYRSQIPNLAGADVTTAGFGVLYSDDPQKANDFDLFWRQVLTIAKCASFHRYGAAAAPLNASHPA
jgi:hypothetical protein